MAPKRIFLTILAITLSVGAALAGTLAAPAAAIPASHLLPAASVVDASDEDGLSFLLIDASVPRLDRAVALDFNDAANPAAWNSLLGETLKLLTA